MTTLTPEQVAQSEAAKVEDKAKADAAKAAEKAAKLAQKEAEKKARDEKKAAEKAEKEAAKKLAAEQRQAEKKAAELAKQAEKEAAKAAKEASRMPEQNGIRRPKPETLCGQAWAIFDEVSAKNGQPASIGESMPLATSRGLNEANVRTEYARWRKFFGITGRINNPAAEPAPVGTEVAPTA